MPLFHKPPPSISSESAPRAEPAFAWLSFSRFVEVYPVRTGWLVMWGRYEDLGAIRHVAGQRTYSALDGVRPRIAAAIREMTGDDALATESLIRFDHTSFPDHQPARLADPL